MKNYPVILWDYFINHKYKDPLKPFSPNQDDSWLLTAIHVHGLRSNFHPKQLACNVVPTSSQSVLGEYLLPREKWGQRMENEWTWEAVWFCFKKKRQPVLGDVSWEWFSLLKIKPKLNLGYNSIYLKFTKYCGLYYVLNCSNAIATTRRSLFPVSGALAVVIRHMKVTQGVTITEVSFRNKSLLFGVIKSDLRSLLVQFDESFSRGRGCPKSLQGLFKRSKLELMTTNHRNQGISSNIAKKTDRLQSPKIR